MSFTNIEKINFSEKLALQIYGTANAPNGEQFWYNESFAWKIINDPNTLWNDFSLILSASNSIQADNNVTNNPNILEKKIMRLTIHLPSNNRAFIARQNFNDPTSAQIENWIQPSLIRDNGSPSNGYVVKLYSGDPLSGGTEITTGFMAGNVGEPSWSYNYASGILLVSTDAAATFKTLYDAVGLYVVGYRYKGATGGSGGGSSTNHIVYHGKINTANQFPTTIDVQTGWLYHIIAAVTDNNPAKTNTGLTFKIDDVVFWDGNTWVKVSGSEEFDTDRILTAEITIEHPDHTQYAGDLFRLILVDNNGNVILSNP